MISKDVHLRLRSPGIRCKLTGHRTPLLCQYTPCTDPALCRARPQAFSYLIPVYLHSPNRGCLPGCAQTVLFHGLRVEKVHMKARSTTICVYHASHRRTTTRLTGTERTEPKKWWTLRTTYQRLGPSPEGCIFGNSS